MNPSDNDYDRETKENEEEWKIELKKTKGITKEQKRRTHNQRRLGLQHVFLAIESKIFHKGLVYILVALFNYCEFLHATGTYLMITNVFHTRLHGLEFVSCCSKIINTLFSAKERCKFAKNLL